ncbi:MAG: 1,4-alpha-glucan branching protein GlgB [Propionibacteriaceae bacterium]|nr:1,4-alpha-glucan branching protein GlgB [Propionibacteriaceae bacterium]
MATYDLAGELRGTDMEGLTRGSDTELWRRLGAHTTTVLDSETQMRIPGVRFSVWAPNAQKVLLSGDFNFWGGDEMIQLPGTGVWSRFIETIGDGTRYKFKILGADGVWREKSDPMAQFAETDGNTAGIVFTSHHQWGDDDWMKARETWEPWSSPVSIYEVHLGAWRQGKTYRELAAELVEYVTWQGYTHVEFMPLSEHPFLGSWGYQTTGYFAPTSRYGNPDDVRYLIDQLHQGGIGVIMDWVPGHFATDEWSLVNFDGTALYEHSDPRQGYHPDWGTYIFNFGRNEVKSFLVSNALYWLQQFHVDGLRVDAVASMLYLDYSREEGQWVPNQYGGRENLEAIDFLKYVNHHLYRRNPGIMMIAEESTSFAGVTKPVDADGLGFGFKWNMGWMNDSLRYIELDPIYRQWHHGDITFSTVYNYSENFILPISHDEVVHGKGTMIEKVPQDDWRKFATLRAFYSYQWAWPGKQLVFMGQEFAQRKEFSASDSLEWWVTDLWGHHGLQYLFHDMNSLYRSRSALWQQDHDPAGFQWVVGEDSSANVFAWLRRDKNRNMVVCVTNFSATPHERYRIGLPEAGVWKEILNTNSEIYDGTGDYLNTGINVRTGDHGGFAHYADIAIPALASVWLEWVPAEITPPPVAPSTLKTVTPESKYPGGYVGDNPPAGYDIKGNEDSMKYHTTESQWYSITVAEVWFNTEEAARAAGFINVLDNKK